jgi:hypothetical protein
MARAQFEQAAAIVLESLESPSTRRALIERLLTVEPRAATLSQHLKDQARPGGREQAHG